jgi:anti-sigma factor RsiW
LNAPTDIELMAFADGELEGERAEEVAEWLASNEEDAARVGELMRLAELVDATATQSLAAEERNRSFDVVGDVMAAVERVDAAARNGKLASTPPPPRVLSMRPSAPRDRETRRSSRRTTYVLGAGILAVAAAAAATLVAFVKEAPHGPMAGPMASMTKSPDSIADPAEDRDVEPSTAVDTVDFGAHQGTIFYVPSGASTSTTVVWIADDEAAK